MTEPAWAGVSPDPGPRDTRRIAHELRSALRNADIPGPFVLVGASLGGPYAAVFAEMYRDEMVALVLVDSVHPDQMQRLPPQAKRALRVLSLANRVLPMLATVGVTHLVDVTGFLLAGSRLKLPADAATQLRAFARWPSHWAEVSIWDDTMEQMRVAMRSTALRGLPLTVLTAPDNPGMSALRKPWLEMQRELAAISSVVTHHVLEGTGHIAMATEPEPIQIVIGAVRDLIETSGGRRPTDV